MVITMTLDELEINQRAIICDIHLKEIDKQRLFHLGVYIGAIISLQAKAPLQDPIIYFVCGSAIVLRRQEAKAIMITLEDSI